MSFDIRGEGMVFMHTVTASPENGGPFYSEHYHPFYELLYFVRGDADFVVRDTRYELRPGMLIVSHPGEYHNVVFRSRAEYERYVLHVRPEELYPALRARMTQTENVYDVQASPIAEVFDGMEERLAAIPPDLQLGICLGAMYHILSHLSASRSLIRQADYVDEEVRLIVDYIDHNLPGIRTADDLAAGLHRSKPALYKSFARQFDVPLMHYVRTQKCMAAQLLLAGGASATDAARQLGFAHYSSFYRDYCAVFGEPPTGVRKTQSTVADTDQT